MTIAIVKPDEKGAALFNSFDEQEVIVVKYKLKNNSKDKWDFESENLEITTTNNEKFNPMRNLSDYYGLDNLVKTNDTAEGTAWFVLNDANEKIDKLLFRINRIMNMDVNKRDYDGKTFNFEVLNVRDSVMKDLKK